METRRPQAPLVVALAVVAACAGAQEEEPSTGRVVAPPSTGAALRAPRGGVSAGEAPETDAAQDDTVTGPTLGVTSARAEGTIEYRGQHLRYPLPAPTSRSVDVAARGTGFDVTVRVLDHEGARLGQASSRGGGTARVELDLDPGSYVVDVAGRGGGTGAVVVVVE